MCIVFVRCDTSCNIPLCGQFQKIPVVVVQCVVAPKRQCRSGSVVLLLSVHVDLLEVRQTTGVLTGTTMLLHMVMSRC